MTNEALKEFIVSIYPQAEFLESQQYLTMRVSPAKLHSFATTLKEREETFFDYLFCVTGVDFPDKSLGVVYHLTSSKHNHILVIKTSTTNRENAELPTVSDIWKTAEFHEREVYDLIGIKFTNHPDMRRIFLEDSWVGHPLRKDYVDEINIVER